MPAHKTGEMYICDGNHAAAYVSYALSDCAFIYPITPSSTMAEYAEAWAAAGEKNIYNQPLHVTEMQSEAGAAGALHGALAAGALGVTYTASQGLLLMIPNMYKIAGELMPCVFHVAARALAGQALSIFGDHSDVMAVRQTGFALLSSHTVQEAQDMALVAHVATLRGQVPFLHFFDGFRLSHELNKISMISYEDMKSLINEADVQRHRDRALNPLHPHLRGTSQGTDIFFQLVEASNKYYDALPEVVESAMRDVERVCGRSYHLFDYVGHPEADRVVVCMGAGSPIVEEAISYVQKRGEKVGLIKVRLYRPWCPKAFMAALPKSAKFVTVLDRTKESGSLGEPLFLDVAATLQESAVPRRCLGGRYGLGSKDFTPGMALAIFENMKIAEPKNHFTVGIEDDVTFTSLPILPEIDTLPTGTTQCLLWGMGSDGTVGANKSAIEIIGNNTDLYAQGYFAYDAHKSGGVTVSHLRFGPEPITAQYFVNQADYIACHHPMYPKKYNVLKGMKDNGTFVLNSPWNSLEQLEKELPNSMKRTIAKKNLKFYNIDAIAVAQGVKLGKRINMIMQTAFFYLAGVLPFERAVQLLKESIQKTYGKKGENIVKMNWAAVDQAVANLKKIEYPASWTDLTPEVKVPLKNAPAFVTSILAPVASMEGDSLPVSTFQAGGMFPAGTTKYEKRSIASQIPIWDAEKCSQCNQCAFVCPHAAIRPYLLDGAEKQAAPAGLVTAKGKGEAQGFDFRIQVSPMDCTGCQICSVNCPDKALTMTAIGERTNAEEPNWDYCTTLPERGDMFDKSTVKGSQFQKPLMEFSGACEGCGETPYVKLLTQLFGKRLIIANATGCSSIWAGTACFNPYTTNSKGQGPAWGNSLFEDNAEYGLGMAQAYMTRRVRLSELVRKALADKVAMSEDLKDLLERWVEAFTDREKTFALAEKIEPLLEAEKAGNPALEAIYAVRDTFPKFSHWIIGGDGWACDIGYGGLDHVIASGCDVKILVLDTEMYSNTGGQCSKSTPMSAIAKFAASGKRRQKKDLGLLAMQYGDVYVATCSLGANFSQVIRAFIEADEYPGAALIVAYAPCIEQGIGMGMSRAPEEQKLAVDTGYVCLYRYNPLLEKQGEIAFQLDSKKLKADVADFLKRENRFAMLARSNPELAKTLQDDLRDHVQKRHQKLKTLAMGDLSQSFEQLKSGVSEGAQGDLSPSGNPPVTVLFGSESGNAEDLAKRIANECKRRGYQRVSCSALDDYDFENLPNERLVLMTCSTAGQGEFPGNAKDFAKSLAKADLPADLLKNVTFCMFGLGDSTYAHYCKAAVEIDERMAALGAKRLLPRGYGDDQAEEKYETGFAEFEENLWTELKAPTPAGDDKPLPAQNLVRVKAGAGAAVNAKGTAMCPSKTAKFLRMICNKRITPDDYDRWIMHIEFDIRNTGVTYQLGDCLAIWGRNSKEDVKAFLDFYGLNGDDMLTIENLNKKAKTNLPEQCTVAQLFECILDLNGRPNRRFFETLWRHAQDAQEKERLFFLLSAEGKEEFRKLAKETITFCDLLRMFPSAKIPIESLMDVIPVIKPRYYSIASSFSAHPDKIQLCIVLVDWKTPSGKVRYGLTTSFLSRCQQPDANEITVACAIKPSAIYLPPSDKLPVLMAGLGTGIAPFRAICQERAWRKANGIEIGQTALFFGCRYRTKDYLYGDEFEQWGSESVITQLRIAFSRDQAKKVYVQDKICEDPAMLWKLLIEDGGYFYICGPARDVPEQIRSAVSKTLAKAKGISTEEADKIIADLKAAGRYNVEAW